ncbi:tetratricopeptide repeat protein [Microlunatus ginsengisoli]|uniref:Tetratricopeptide repeat protein n=1 Tax=Microlunatus ginsengisoli TaxID=363863 RepID=A0ABP7B0D3_9ACTN
MWELVRARYRHRQALLFVRVGDQLSAEKMAARAVQLMRHRLAHRSAASHHELFDALITHAQILTSLMRLGQAEAAYADALKVSDTVNPTTQQRVHVAQVLIAKADVHRRRADYPQADATLAACLELLDSLASSQHLIGPWNNMAGIVAKETGRFEEAAKHYATALARCGSDDEFRASILHNLAGLAYMEGRFREAEQPARVAVELRQALNGPGSTLVAADRVVLGAVLAEIGEQEQAEQHLRDALTIWRDQFGTDHYEVGATLHTLASLHLQQGKLREASAELSKALRIKVRVLGPDHPEVATILSNIGVLHARAGRWDQAQQHQANALSVLSARYGVNHPFTLRAQARLTDRPHEPTCTVQDRHDDG